MIWIQRFEKLQKIISKNIFRLMNNEAFGKTMKNVRKHRYIKLVTIKARKNYLVSETKYHTTLFFFENLFATEMKKHKYSWINLSI